MHAQHRNVDKGILSSQRETRELSKRVAGRAQPLKEWHSPRTLKTLKKNLLEPNK